MAAPLTKGSASGEGVNQPGRRQEDDVNIVAYTGHGTDAAEVANALTRPSHGASWSGNSSDTFIAGPLGGGNDGIGRRSEDDPNTVVQTGVRRLTPRECERLQGLPDDWTQLGSTPDSRRYSALGDAVTATVSEWIGRRFVT